MGTEASITRSVSSSVQTILFNTIAESPSPAVMLLPADPTRRRAAISSNGVICIGENAAVCEDPTLGGLVILPANPSGANASIAFEITTTAEVWALGYNGSPSCIVRIWVEKAAGN